MWALVQTYRLGSEEEVNAELQWASGAAETISDQSARTIASWWHSPNQTSIVRLSHGISFDTEELRAEIVREIADSEHALALTNWVDALEILLSETA